MEPYSTNPFERARLSISTDMGFVICDSSNNQIATSSLSIMSSSADGFVAKITGTFSASGTEFYIRDAYSHIHWKISNVTFASGDTFAFNVNTTIS